MYMFVCMYIYICVCIPMYLYIERQDRLTHRDRERETFPLGSMPGVLEGVKLALASRKL